MFSKNQSVADFVEKSKPIDEAGEKIKKEE